LIVVKLYKAALLTFALLASSLAAAQLAAPSQGKVAVLDPVGAVMRTDEAQKRLKALRAQPAYDANNKEREKLIKEFQDMVQQLQKDNAVMSVDQRQAQGKKIEDKRSDIEHVERKLQESEQELMQKLMQDLGGKLQKVVTDLIKAEGIGLLLDRKAAIHVDNGYDLSPKVTEQLNKTN
jgi:outer membrane protein